MTFPKMIKKYALEFAAKNAIVKHGEIVETLWADWKKPHKVKIYDIGATLATNSWRIIKGKRRYIKSYPRFCMYYFALRLKTDETPKDKAGCGIALTNFKKADGTIWQEMHGTINHASYSWRLPKGK